MSATAFCAALSKMSDRPVDDRSFLPAYQRWRHFVRPLEEPDELAAHLQKIAAQPGSSIAFLALQLPGSGPSMLSSSTPACISNGVRPSLMLCGFSCGVSEAASNLTFGAPYAAGQQAQAVSAQQGARPESSARSSAGALGLHLPVDI